MMIKENSQNNNDRCRIKVSRIAAVLLLSIAMLSSCQDYLNIDNYFSDELKLDSVFKKKRYIEAYLWDAAARFPDEGSLLQNSYTPGPLATDEAFTAYATSGGYNGMRFVLGEITANSMYSLNNWSTMYKIIRKCNTIINRIDEVQDMTTVERFNLLGNTRFVRAYAYYNLLMDFGPPILLGDEVVENNEDLAYYDRPRATYDEAVEYICNEFEEAALYLSNRLSIMDFGKPTKGAAYGLIARIRLTHASPLYNGGQAARTCFGKWKRSTDGAYYVSQTEDPRRWALAAAAAKKVMNMGIYNLHVIQSSVSSKSMPQNVDAAADPDYYELWPKGAAGIDHFKSYSDMFTGESVMPTNPEYVWGKYSTTLKNNTQMAFPNTVGGWNGLSVTQKVVDAYSMFDGRSIYNSSSEYPYSESGFTLATENFSGYRLNANVFNMYANREMRFYASVGFSECFWTMSSTNSSNKYNQTISYLYDGNNGKNTSSNPLNYTPTGYVIKKFIHESDAWDGDNAQRTDKGFGIIRYADILLMYAEALNNLGSQSYTIDMGENMQETFTRNTDAIKSAFNQVRHRAGLPGISDAELANASTVQQLIEKERMVEFLFENRRYFDVRRWGKYEETESVTITGMNVEGNKESYYRRTIPSTSRIGARVVNKKLVLLPIPLSEVRILPSLDQNPGWEN